MPGDFSIARHRCVKGNPPRKPARGLLAEWVHRLEERELLVHVLAGYEVKRIYCEYCPPIHLQQLKKALVSRDEAKRVEVVLDQFPARKISVKKLEDASRSIRRTSHEETLYAGLQFAEDFMRFRRDRRNYQHVVVLDGAHQSRSLGALPRTFARE